jgi:hypothetical protein
LFTTDPVSNEATDGAEQCCDRERRRNEVVIKTGCHTHAFDVRPERANRDVEAGDGGKTECSEQDEVVRMWRRVSFVDGVAGGNGILGFALAVHVFVGNFAARQVRPRHQAKQINDDERHEDAADTPMIADDFE